MSIMDMFRTAPTPALRVEPTIAQPTQVATNPTVPNPTTGTPTGNGPVAFPATGAGDKSPLDQFAKLWEAPADGSPTPAPLVPLMNLDPAKLRTAAESINFTGHIPDELMAKAATGDVAALRQVINQTAQMGFANGVASSGQLTQQAFNTAQGNLTDKLLPETLRNNQISQEIQRENPAFNNPAVAPMLGMLQNQLTAKYPTASPQEIAGMAKEYLSGMATTVVSGNGGVIQQPGQGQSQKVRVQQDWSTFLKS